MGIPRLFAWLYKTYPQCITAIRQYENVASKSIVIDSYALDLNAIIHPVCQRMYNYGQPQHQTQRFLMRNRKPPHQKTVFSEICKVIETLRQLVSPRHEFIIAIDGTAGMGKQSQQRQRRFKSAQSSLPSSNNSPDKFDSNCITTGSEFMYNLSGYIHRYIKIQLESNPEWSGLSVVYSNEKVYGEGEHKIVRYIERYHNPDWNYCIHSPDADLIMLSIPLRARVYIIRENIYRDVDAQYFVVDVDVFKSIFYNLLRWVSPTHTCSETGVLHDFILLCFFLGNDFLPHISSLEITNRGLDNLLDMYPRVAMQYGHLVISTESGLGLNETAMCELFKILSDTEPQALYTKAVDKDLQFPDPLLTGNLTGAVGQTQTFDFQKYRREYYAQRLHCKPDESGEVSSLDVDVVCREYFRGLVFVLRYYLTGMPDWNWYYPYYYAPLFCDMQRCITGYTSPDFSVGRPLTPLQQLLCVLPPASSRILPPALQPLLSPESSLRDYYPLEFPVHLYGKHAEWEGVAILPPVNPEVVIEQFNLLSGGLTDEERKRDIPGKTQRYTRRYNGVVTSVVN
jgi:5'-3' exonuclease